MRRRSKHSSTCPAPGWDSCWAISLGRNCRWRGRRRITSWSSWRPHAAEAGLRNSLETVLEAALEAELVEDAAIAETGAHRDAIWKLREEHAEAQKREGASVKNDVSVPIARVPELIDRATDALARMIPGVRAVPFGHLGDGNIHLEFRAAAGNGCGRVPGAR